MEISYLIMLFVWLLFILFGKSSTQSVDEAQTVDQLKQITCSELKNIAVIGSIFVALSSREKNQVSVDFYLSTNKKRTPVTIGPGHWSVLKSSAFDPSAKTFIIIHGYKSGGTKSWVLEMKEKLLDTRNGNVIMVDWSKASNRKNYVNAARNTLLASNRIFNFFQTLRTEVDMLGNIPKEIQWNHLHFIGHSLGAQISGQTAHLLKQDQFWKIERITGLDPAKPCFMNVDKRLRIDKEDADFVDIIHTQIGTGGTADALGLLENVGHMDFYVNTGIVQPGCMGGFLNPVWSTMICSHKLAYKYFTESIANSKTGKCQFQGHPWNGTYEAASVILNIVEHGDPSDVYMGIDAPLSGHKSGVFLVFTSPNEPFCDIHSYLNGSLGYRKKLIAVIMRLRGLISIFTPEKIKNPDPTKILNLPYYNGRALENRVKK